jgi:raffinose/stachyose/melibiose transport system permease protein
MTKGAAQPTTPAATARRPRGHRSGRRRNWLGGAAGWLWLGIVIVPIYWILITSFKAQSDYFQANAMSPPADPTMANYRLVLQAGFTRYFVNSLVVAFGTVVPAVAVSFRAAFAVVRSGGRFLPSIAFAIPLSVLVLSNFIRDVPKDLFESMRTDGASEWGMLWHLALPLSRPALVTVSTYNALTVWNGFLLPLVLTADPSRRTLPLALWSFQGPYGYDVPAILASVVLTTLPIVALYAVGRRQLLSGLTAGSGK